MLLALGGLLAGHLASYFFVAPDAHERAELLARTGHGGHGLFPTIALAASFAAVIGLFSQGLRVRRPTTLVAGRGRLTAVLWAAQTAGFVVLETWERGHGVPGVLELAHEPAFLTGLVAQLLVAVIAATVVRLVRATADALLRLFSPQVENSSAPVFSAGAPARPRASVARAAWNLRGPPAPAF